MLLLACGAASAQETTKCKFEFTCANTHPCQTTKTDLGVNFEYKILPESQLRIDLGDGDLPVLKIVRVSEDLTTAHGWDATRSAAYTFSVFADDIVAYTTHTFVGKGISLTAFGRCELKD